MNSVFKFILLIIAVLATGCAHGPAKYASNRPVNMTITTKLDKIPQAYVAFDINHINRKCELAYDGRVELSTGTIDIGLPTGEPLYMEVIFARSNGSVREGAIMVLRQGSKYYADFNYVNGIYSAELFESRAGEKNRRKISMIPLQACTAS